jgi:hypothetical protein
MRYALLATLLLAATPAAAGDALDLSKVERRIAREPQRVCAKPRYCLVLLGPEAKTRIWMLVDKSQADAKHYDVAYVDLNANGDLTDEGERFQVQPNPDGESHFKFPDLVDRATGQTHTLFKLTVAEERRTLFLVALTWNGKWKMAGGYPENPDGGYMQFGATPEEAPILHANGDGPFQFQFWYPEKLAIGGQTDVKLFVGLPGVGRNSFWAFSQHVLPEKIGVDATPVYEDTSGNTHELPQPLLERC